ncbi:MAG TPA: hypothetical protein VH370_16630 [Humisphaera sp.]|jgi:lipopolysaccharide biosynthesis regulator YciM|nr:hypothetical protein [Humisphaera sp.]
MRIRPKTRRRLLIVLTVSAVVCVAIGWAYLLSERRGAARILELRRQGLARFAAGDDAKAATLLADYLDKSKSQDSDTDALLAYGKARINVPLPQHQEIYEGIQTFQSYLQLKPADNEARRLLLNLYVRANYNQEAIKLADQMLADNAADAPALQGKIGALVNQRNFPAALAVCRQLNAIAPNLLTAQFRTVELMRLAKISNQELIDYGKTLHDQHKGDPRFAAVLAYAYRCAGHEPEERAALHEAAGQVAGDPDFVITLAAMLDGRGMYADADGLLRRSTIAMSDERLQRMVAQRLWQDRDLAELLKRTQNLNPASAKDDSLLLGYRAMALFEMGKSADGSAIVAALGKRSGDQSAAAWAAALKSSFVAPLPAPAARLKSLQTAAFRDPNNPAIQVMLGLCYAQMGESDLALLSWKQASAQAISWAQPLVLSAQVLTNEGKLADAMTTAHDAVNRAPTDVEVAMTEATIWYTYNRQFPAKANDKDLLAFVEQIQKVRPNDPRILPIDVDLLARANRRDEATRVLRDSAHVVPALSSDVLLKLAQVSDANHLDVGAQLRQQVAEAGGMTPSMAFSEARVRAKNGDAAAGLASLTSSAAGHESDAAWRLAIARYRDLASDPAALKDWIAIGDQFPADLQVQTAILQSPTRKQDRAFWERSIARVRQLTGETGLVWRLDRARWLLAGELPEKDLSEAVNLLTELTHTAPNLPDPHYLMAQALLHATKSNTSRAITELIAADDDGPGNPAVVHDLVKLLIDNERQADALSRIERLLATPDLSSPARQWAARELALLGKPDRAIAVLEDDQRQRPQDIDRDIALAGLYRKSGKPDQTAPLYRALLDAPTPAPAALAEAADFFASRHESDAAQKLMERIGKASLKPGELELYQAAFAERWKSAEDALASYLRATKTAPKNANTWAALSGFFLRQQKYSRAAAAATEGLSQASASGEPLKALQHFAGILEATPNAASLLPLTDLLSRNPLMSDAGRMLETLALAHQSGGSADAIAAKADEVAQQLPKSFPVQLMAAQLQASAGHYDRAAKLAARAAAISPAASEPQALLTSIYVETRDWSRATEAVNRWRELSGDAPAPADLMAARIALYQPRRDPRAAIARLTPYLNAPLSQQQKDTALSLYARALIGAGRADEAAQLLQPLVGVSKAWRMAWLNLSDAGHKNRDAALAWINQVAPLVQHEAPDESLALAKAWYETATQFDSTADLQSCRDVLHALIDTDAASGEAWMLWGMASQTLGDYDAAIDGFRHATIALPTSADAKNDLAYVFWLRGHATDLPEAQRLAEAAIAIAPNIASFYDTLARIQAQEGQPDAAIKTFRTALAKDSTSVEAMIGLADLLARDTFHRNEARNLVSEINRRLKLGPSLSSPLRKQYESARTAVAESM